MKVAFVNTLYLVALFNSTDQWHERAIAASRLVAETKLITTEDVLVELLVIKGWTDPAATAVWY